MIYKCPNCNGALEYNPATDKMECAHCGGGYTVAEIEASQKKEEHTYNRQTGRQDVLVDGKSAKKASADENIDASEEEIEFFAERETMDCKIYTCTSCGAELMLNENEAASFCAYCGQPTVVFSRVSNELKPDSIVPFKITKEQAVNAIRDYLKGSYFVPNVIKKFSVDKVRGIYIPYWVFDIYYHDIQIWEYLVEEKGYSRTIPISREAECMFTNLTVDASKNLNNELSQRIEPYDVRTKKPFEAAYLSGCYADKYDLDEEYMRKYAKLRAKTYFDAEVKKTLPGGFLKISNPKCRIKTAEYMFLPAWFITFRYQYETYTLAVNGQTGKIVGTVPFDKGKVIRFYIAIALVACILTTLAMMTIMTGTIETLLVAMNADIFIFLAFIYSSKILKNKIEEVKYTMNMTKSYQTADYVQERQDRS